MHGTYFMAKCPLQGGEQKQRKRIVHAERALGANAHAR